MERDKQIELMKSAEARESERLRAWIAENPAVRRSIRAFADDVMKRYPKTKKRLAE